MITLIDTKRKAIHALDALWRATKDGTPYALDSEFDPEPWSTLTTFSFSWGLGVRYVVEAEYLFVLADWFGDKKSRIVYSFFKADARTFLKNWNLDLRPSFHADIVSLSWLRDENNERHGLKQQTRRYLGRKRDEFKNLFSYKLPGRKTALQLNASQVSGRAPLPEGALLTRSAEEWRRVYDEYGGDDAEDTIRLYWKHRKYLESIGYWQTYLRVDRPYTLTLMGCEDRGILIDLDGMDQVRSKSLVAQARAEHVLRALMGYPDLNLEAKDQVKQVLIEELGWPTYADLVTKKTGKPQFTQAVIRRWIKEGIEVATLFQKRSVYAKLAKDLKSLMSGCSEDGRLRSDYNQHGTRTGRISSRKWTVSKIVERKLKSGKAKTQIKKEKKGANLQNVVSPGEKDPWGVKERFIAPKKGQITARGVPAKEDHVLIVVDMSGFELVLTINRVGRFVPVEESRLLKTMLKYKAPSAIHVLTTIHSFNLDEDVDAVFSSPESLDAFKKKYKDLYRIGKEENFGLIYGGTWYTLARRRRQDTRLPEVQEENEALVDNFFNVLYPELVIFQKRSIAEGYKKGYLETISGRRVHVAEGLASFDKREREHWERICCNMPQCDAADIIKEAMNRIENDEELRSKGFSQLSQVHDEIVGECPRSASSWALERVSWHMSQPYKNRMLVPLSSEGKSAENWTLAKG